MKCVICIHRMDVYHPNDDVCIYPKCLCLGSSDSNYTKSNIGKGVEE